MEQQNKQSLTKTPQEIVHIQHTITVRQYKYWFLLLKTYKDLWEAGIEADEKGFYTFSLADLAQLIGYEPVKKELKADLEALRKEPIIINYFEKDKKSATHGMGFISEWKVTSTQIAFKLPSFLENVMRGDIEAKQLFLMLNWEIFNSFGGKYESIIYKLCKDYIGVGRTPYMSIEKYRKYIGLKDNEYKATDNLTRRCITKPIDNINKSEISDIVVEVVFERNGMKIEGLHFKMQYKEKSPLLEIAPIEPNPAFEKSLITIPPNKQLEYLGQFSEEQIKAIIDRANDYIDKLKADGKKASVGAIYNKAFAESWGLENFEAEQKAKAEEEERKRQAKAKKEAEERAKKEVEEKIRQEEEFNKKCIDLFWGLPKETQEEILDIAQSRLNPFVIQSFKKKRENNIKDVWDFPLHYKELKEILKEKNMI